ncbi:MAG: CBS domain-containing protein [Spirochaetia bacterium]|nr:CBS domain-containing protein [Spirochaetia bacterium]
MVIITSHLNADFDAFASMVAASKLYKDPVLYVPGGFSASMRRFYTFYKHIFPIEKHLKKLDVTSIVAVDAGLANIDPQLERLALSGIKTEIFDHHPHKIAADQKNISFNEVKYGACTTYFVERLLAQKADISNEEAMLYLLGIASDTGSFTFLTTKPQDVRASASLMERGINMKLYNDFLKNRMDADAPGLFNALMNNSKITSVSGCRVMTGGADLEHHIRQLPDIVREQSAAWKMLRSTAGSAPRAKTVADIMSSPVRAIEPQIRMDAAYKICIRLNNNGLPIVKKNRLIGFITRADIEKGIHHKMGAIPVAGFMTTKVLTTTPETQVFEARAIMEKNNIGHLPVVHNNRLVGMVTGNDILNRVYGGANKKNTMVFTENRLNVSGLIKKRMSPETLALVRRIGEYADKKHMPAYLVGGMVRDMFLNVKDLDIDITVEGDGMEFARSLADNLGAAYKGFDRFKTGKIFMKNGIRIDVASARSEFYEFPAALPSIRFTPVRYDLYRRDFTINAMAIRINKKGFGSFIDYFNGRRDLGHGIIRTLYNMSFIDDPTRILRAVRFETRYGFTIEENTLRFIKETLKHDIFENLPGERLKEELFMIFNEPKPFKAIRRLGELGVLDRISGGITVNCNTEALFEKIGREEAMIKDYGADRNLLYFMAMLGNVPAYKARAAAEKLKLSNEGKIAVSQAGELQALTGRVSRSVAAGRSRIYFFLKKYGTEALIYMMLALKDKNRAAGIKQFLDELRHVKIDISGRDLAAMGIEEGPEYSGILTSVMKAKLDGKASTREAQLRLAASIRTKNERSKAEIKGAGRQNRIK